MFYFKVKHFQNSKNTEGVSLRNSRCRHQELSLKVNQINSQIVSDI